MAIIDDIAQQLADSGLGTLGSDIFKSYLPDNGDDLIAVLDTGGVAPDAYIPVRKPTFQVVVRSSNYSDGRTMLDAVRAALHQQANTTIGSTYFYYILAQSDGGHIGRNERGLDEFSINFIALIR